MKVRTKTKFGKVLTTLGLTLSLSTSAFVGSVKADVTNLEVITQIPAGSVVPCSGSLASEAWVSDVNSGIRPYLVESGLEEGGATAYQVWKLIPVMKTDGSCTPSFKVGGSDEGEAVLGIKYTFQQLLTSTDPTFVKNIAVNQELRFATAEGKYEVKLTGLTPGAFIELTKAQYFYSDSGAEVLSSGDNVAEGSGDGADRNEYAATNAIENLELVDGGNAITGDLVEPSATVETFQVKAETVYTLATTDGVNFTLEFASSPGTSLKEGFDQASLFGVASLLNDGEVVVVQMYSGTDDTGFLFGVTTAGVFLKDPSTGTIGKFLEVETTCKKYEYADSADFSACVEDEVVAAIQVALGVTDPTATDPTATDPTATDPTATDPTATDPTATDPTATDPTATDPTATDPTATDPTATDPTATDPTATDPTATDPNTSESSGCSLSMATSGSSLGFLISFLPMALVALARRRIK